MTDNEKKKVTEAIKFLETEEGKDKEFLSFVDKIIHSRITLYYIKNLQFYIFCELMDWFNANKFLPNKNDGEKISIARNLATKIALDLGGVKYNE